MAWHNEDREWHEYSKKEQALWELALAVQTARFHGATSAQVRQAVLVGSRHTRRRSKRKSRR